MATNNETKKEQEVKKSAPRGEKVSTSFKNTIKVYLDKRAAVRRYVLEKRPSLSRRKWHIEF